MIKKPLKIAVLVSGSGSNLQVLIDKQQAKQLPIHIVGVISNVAQAYAVTRANHAQIDTVVFDKDESGKKLTRIGFEKKTIEQLKKWQPDLVVLAGFMKILTPTFIDDVANICPMINLHPSILPAYKGLDTHQRVINTGDKHHGCSVHLVTAELDAGQVLTQAVLSVECHDTSQTLQKRVQRLEHFLLPLTIELMIKQVIDVTNPQSLAQLPYQFFYNK